MLVPSLLRGIARSRRDNYHNCPGLSSPVSQSVTYFPRHNQSGPRLSLPHNSQQSQHLFVSGDIKCLHFSGFLLTDNKIVNIFQTRQKVDDLFCRWYLLMTNLQGLLVVVSHYNFHNVSSNKSKLFLFHYMSC